MVVVVEEVVDVEVIEDLQEHLVELLGQQVFGVVVELLDFEVVVVVEDILVVDLVIEEYQDYLD